MIQLFSARMHLMLGLTGLLVLVGGFGGWAASTQIAGAVIAPGRIEVERNRQVVQHETGGVVSEILVDEGDFVEAGAVLIRLDAARLASDLAIADSQYFELLARQARLQAERDGAEDMRFRAELLERAGDNADLAEVMAGQVRLFEARNVSTTQEREQLARRGEQIMAQIEGIEAQIEAMERQLNLIREELQGQQRLLDRGLAQGQRVLALQREEAALSGQLGEIIASKARAEGQLTELELQDLRLGSQRREAAITELRDLRNQELELFERRRALQEQLTRLDVRAPVSGLVYGLNVQTKRAVVRPAEPILYVVPQDRPLIIAARVEPKDIDQIHLNQNVILRFSSLEGLEAPEFNGLVQQISADAFVDEASGVSYYRAEVILPEEEIAKLPEEVVLIPGMPVETLLRTADRTALAYLIQPFRDYFSRAFREG